jgi:phospholipid/cholesterol/gamma-HCH transport system substrate-binding protein
MENKAHAMAAGIFVVVLAATLLALAAWLTRDRGAQDVYEISTRESVTGLQPQSPVRLRGVDVGKVSQIGFDPKVQGNVLLRLEVDEGLPITRDTFATLNQQGVTGLAYIQLSDHGRPAPRLVPNDEVPPRIPMEPSFISRLEDRGEAILDQAEQVTARLNRLLSDDNQKRIASALERLDEAAGSARQLAQRLDNSAARHLDPALDQTAQAMRSVRTTSDEVGRAARRLNEKDGPVDRLSEGTEALSHAADNFNMATLPRINRVTEDASRAVRQLGRTMRDINENPQSLIYGRGEAVPGPGEPGFQPPGGAR